MTEPSPYVGKCGIETDRQTCRIVGPPPEPDRRSHYTSYLNRVLFITFINTWFIIPVTDTTVLAPSHWFRVLCVPQVKNST